MHTGLVSDHKRPASGPKNIYPLASGECTCRDKESGGSSSHSYLWSLKSPFDFQCYIALVQTW